MGLSVARNLAKFRLTPGDISGLTPFWITNGVGVSVGSCYIPGTGRMLVVPAGIALTVSYTAGSLPINTFHYLYVYEDAAGAPKLEMSVVAPQSYWNTSYQKGTDATRRFVGAVKTGASGNIINFQVLDNVLHYLGNLNAAPFRVLDAGTATAQTSVNLRSMVPPTTENALLNVINGSASVTVVLTTTNPNSAGGILFALIQNTRIKGTFPLSNGTIGYSNSAGAGSTFIDVAGFGMDR